ncbi:acetyltransferase YpeA [Roseibium sp. TrichSKD4]|nr:acetyltransferase YpeA [Roseibium sp. TrichSKD4]
MASAMFGYDGHRGWLYYFAVLPEFQGQGHARAMLDYGETALMKLGCPKINFQVRADNNKAIAYYQAAGYTEDQVLSFGKRLIQDN